MSDHSQEGPEPLGTCRAGGSDHYYGHDDFIIAQLIARLDASEAARKRYEKALRKIAEYPWTQEPEWYYTIARKALVEL